MPSYHHLAGTAHAKTRRLLEMSVMVALIAGAQETFQLLYQQRAFEAVEQFDFASDTGAAALGLMTPWAWNQRVQWRRLTVAMPPRDLSAG